MAALSDVREININRDAMAIRQLVADPSHRTFQPHEFQLRGVKAVATAPEYRTRVFTICWYVSQFPARNRSLTPELPCCK